MVEEDDARLQALAHAGHAEQGAALELARQHRDGRELGRCARRSGGYPKRESHSAEAGTGGMPLGQPCAGGGGRSGSISLSCGAAIPSA
eukprot:scaffold5475_cov127-Isochrysis_galbana.AAC.9